MTEYAIVNDEGVIEDGFYSIQEALSRVSEAYSEDDDMEIHPRNLYDDDGNWIEYE